MKFLGIATNDVEMALYRSRDTLNLRRDIQVLNASLPSRPAFGREAGACDGNRMCPCIASYAQCAAPSPTSENGPQIAG